MFEDIVKSHLKPGVTTRAEVISLLGAPDSELGMPNFIGYLRHFYPEEFHYLRIEFDKTGRVVEASEAPYKDNWLKKNNLEVIP